MKALLKCAFAFSLILSCSVETLASVIPQYKHETVQRIFNDLKAAKGIFPHEEPQLIFEPVFVGTDNFIFAYIDYAKSEIHLEEMIYDVCVRDLGADSLNGIAFMLGHELAHFLNRHENVSHHSPRENSSLMGDRVLVEILKGRIQDVDSTMLANISTSIHHYNEREGEAIADLEGGFISYLAGYSSDRTEPTLPSLFLEKIYMAAEADTDMKGYPKLEERQAIASSSKTVLDSLIHLYEMGNALASIEHYEEALTYYEILTRTFESREIYNNMGVNAFLDASKCFLPEYLPKKIPITLDVDSRLEGGTRGDDLGYDDAVRARKLNVAIRYFEKAAQMDDEYPIALLNLSVTRLLRAISFKVPVDSTNMDLTAFQNQLLLAKAAAVQGEMGAKRMIERLKNHHAQQAKMKNILSNIYIQLASIAGLENKPAEKEAWNKAAAEVDANNIFLANLGEEPNVGMRTEIICDKMETVMSGKNLLDLTSILKHKWSPEVRIKSTQMGMFEETQTFQRYEDNEITAYNHAARISTGAETLMMLVYPKSNFNSVCGVDAGANVDELIEKYGKPVKYFAVTGGSYFVYDREKQGSAIHDGVVFFVDNLKKVKSWFTYIKMTK